MSIILNCAACNKALPYNAKRCAACKVRYCSKECQSADWQNGHKKMCKKIARHGGVEKFEAEVHGARFSTAAVELCGGDLPADAVCSICEQRGDEPILRKLLDAGANVRARDTFGRTALHVAIERNHPRAVAMLGAADGGAALTLGDNDGMLPLHLLCNHSDPSASVELLEAPLALSLLPI